MEEIQVLIVILNQEGYYGKLEGWKEKLLKQTGKEILIKAVIQAIPSYVMSIAKFPNGFCENLCSKVIRFWWSRNGRDISIH